MIRASFVLDNDGSFKGSVSKDNVVYAFENMDDFLKFIEVEKRFTPNLAEGGWTAATRNWSMSPETTFSVAPPTIDHTTTIEYTMWNIPPMSIYNKEETMSVSLEDLFTVFPELEPTVGEDEEEYTVHEKWATDLRTAARVIRETEASRRFAGVKITKDTKF